MANLTRITRFGMVNAYLVREDDGFTVVDTMIPNSAKSIVKAAERAGVPIVRIGSLEVIAGPGHTPGHIALLDSRDRTLLCGDVFSTLGGVATSARVNPRFPLPTLATWHRPTELESSRRLRDLEPARLASGHGKVVDSPVEAMDAAIRRAGG